MGRSRDNFWKRHPPEAAKRARKQCHAVNFDKHWDSNLEFKKLKSHIDTVKDINSKLKKKGKEPLYGPDYRETEFELQRGLCEALVISGLVGKQ